MVVVELLGGVGSEGAGHPLAGKARQRHPVALFALLAVGSPTAISRDKLLAYLWPEKSTESARNRLNQTVHALRQALGPEAILSQGASLALDPDLVTSDVRQFEEALAEGDAERAVALYRGPLLDGFFLDGSAEFERWVHRERARLEHGYRGALEQLAEQAAAEGRHVEAANLWRRLGREVPYNSRVTLRLMDALEAAGDPAGAIRWAERHAARLQEDLGAKPPSEVRARAERIRTAPRAVAGAVAPDSGESAEVEVSGANTAGYGGEAPDRVDAIPVTPAPSSGSAIGRRPKAALVALVVAGLGYGGYTLWARSAPASGPAREPAHTPAVAVLPFVDMSPAGDQAYLGDGVAEEILEALAKLERLEVKARTSSYRFRDSEAGIRVIADSLGVDALLEGSTRKAGNRVRVTAQLIDGETENQLWSDSYDRRLEDIFGVEEEIAAAVVAALEVELGASAEDTIVDRRTENPEAYEYYLRARDLWKTRDPEKGMRAIELYRQAIEWDSTYAAAWAGLADAYLVAGSVWSHRLPRKEGFELATRAAERALELDPSRAQPHATLAALLGARQEWKEAEREFRRALALNPSHPTAHQWYSLLLGALGRMEEGLAHARRAFEADPLARQINRNLSFFLYRTGRYEEFLEHRARMLELDLAGEEEFHRWTGRGHLATGRAEEALAHFRRAREVATGSNPEIGTLTAVALSNLGRRGEAEEALKNAKRLRSSSAPHLEVEVTVGIAEGFSSLGEVDSAFAWIDRLRFDPVTLGILRGRPTFEPIRSDPRFLRLLERAGLNSRPDR